MVLKKGPGTSPQPSFPLNKFSWLRARPLFQQLIQGREILTPRFRLGKASSSHIWSCGESAGSNPNLALQNPHLIGGLSFYVFAQAGKILVMLDHDGDENYVPMYIPLGGGFPEPAFGGQLAANRVHGIRAAVIDDAADAALARAHNDLNVLSLAARRVVPAEVEGIVAAFLQTPFAGGRHERRVHKL